MSQQPVEKFDSRLLCCWATAAKWFRNGAFDDDDDGFEPVAAVMFVGSRPPSCIAFWDCRIFADVGGDVGIAGTEKQAPSCRLVD